MAYEPQVDLSQAPDSNRLRVLLATDNHLGFLEDDPVRSEDSFTTFEEILKIGRDMHVDMVLLGGDLFHINKPSRSTMSKTIRLFKKYCCGERDVDLEVWGKFEGADKVNYEDPNLAVDMPVFAIHGNHDDPTRDGPMAESLSALNILADMGLINYFGKINRVSKAQIEPVLIKKNSAMLKLYGLGWVRDERLHRMFTQNTVEFLETPTFEGGVDSNDDDWFNLMLVHQNRDHRGRGKTNCFKENMIPGFMDLVSFGHEHDCNIEPMESVHDESILLMQPGSSVATTLSEGESNPKNVCIMEIGLYDGQPSFRMEAIPLSTIRPFIYSELSLREFNDEAEDEAMTEEERLKKVEGVIKNKIEEMIVQAKQEYKESHPDATDKELKRILPLLRLQVDYTDSVPINATRLGAKFERIVANPNSMIGFSKKRRANTSTKANSTSVGEDGVIGEEPDKVEETPNARINNLVLKALADSDHLKLLDEKEFNEKIQNFVIKGETRVLQTFIDQCLSRQQDSIASKMDMDASTPGLKPDELTRLVQEQRDKMKKDPVEEAETNEQTGPNIIPQATFTGKTQRRTVPDSDDSDFGDSPAQAKTMRKKKVVVAPPRKKTIPRRATTSKTSAKSKRVVLSDDSDDMEAGNKVVEDDASDDFIQDSDEEEQVKPKTKRTRRASPAKKHSETIAIDDSSDSDATPTRGKRSGGHFAFSTGLLDIDKPKRTRKRR
mmetsp:Transcript_22751/g.36290  ORF Transcript_22751/g.36290 Transcript_22751/m.36290 type:complete len:722 (+) Transcript_22751:129-2294(+)